MSRRNLNLNALRAFESAARLRSFTRAADELFVTHAAISHQVRLLEERLGVRLFERTRRGVELTEPGAALLPELKQAFDRVSAVLEQIAERTSPAVLTVTATPTFASRWLVPRLYSWCSQRDGSVNVHLLPTLRMLDLVRGEADIAIRCGIPPWSELKSELLLPVHMTPVCSGALGRTSERLREPRDLLHCTLLHADVGNNPLGTEWRTWLAATGVVAPHRLPGLSFQDPALSIQAAANSVGFAIGYVELVQPELSSGNLVQPFKSEVRHPYSYYLVYPAARENEPAIKEFRSWIFHEMNRARDLEFGATG